ncbi:hypothetical protein CS022_17160 [Veronia nyctiphanis]|uniref:Uncharacterized protein n=1 Tax=Veronia nyctiphanis TaxID=1278244 RepID=A0A4Q0YQG2_9GAMM|nr:hypothetical protein [Veronia nyctiphanis]RXJ72274.1 hypothetical protein CS022_17160 [Veronia nyctiphanis]
MSINHISDINNEMVNAASDGAIRKAAGQFEWSVFWCRPWSRLHTSWFSVLDASFIADSIAEAMHYDEILEVLNIPFAPEPEIINPLTLTLSSLDVEQESRVFSFISAILTDGHVAGDLSDDERVWCYRFSMGLNLHQYGEEHRNTILSILQDDTQHPVGVLAAYTIRSWSKNDSAFWSRYRVRFNKDQVLPEADLLISPAKLNYIIKTALSMTTQSLPIAKQVPEVTEEHLNEINEKQEEELNA